jgi:hypothetical protein
MRIALATLILGLACFPLHAQHPEKPASSKGHTVSKDAQPPKGPPSPAAKMQQEDQEERRRAKKQQFDPARPQNQRAPERVPGDPPPDHGGHTVSKDSQPPKGQPSPAAKMQQEQAKEFQKRAGDEGGRSVGCSAYPACSRPGLACQGVARNYGNANAATSKNDIISHCRDANTPDPCDCARQCARVARCSIF